MVLLYSCSEDRIRGAWTGGSGTYDVTFRNGRFTFVVNDGCVKDGLNQTEDGACAFKRMNDRGGYKAWRWKLTFSKNGKILEAVIYDDHPDRLVIGEGDDVLTLKRK